MYKANFWPKVLILELKYQPFKLKIHLKLSLKGRKQSPIIFWTAPNQLSKSKKNFDPKNGQITGTNFGRPKISNIMSKMIKTILKSFPLYACPLKTIKKL